MRLSIAVVVLGVVGSSVPAVNACSCGDDETVDVAFERASEVFVARAVSVTLLPVLDDPTQQGWAYQEVVAVQVVEVFKGPIQINSTIQILGWRGAGSCSRMFSAHPKTPFRPTDRSRAVPAESPGVWLIYHAGDAGYAVSSCGRDKPVTASADAELSRLRKLSAQARAHASTRAVDP